MEEGHHRYPLFQGSVQMTTHSENRIYSLENGTRLLNRETFRAGCVQESGNWLRFRSRPHRGIANPFLSSRSWPSSLDEFRGPGHGQQAG